MHELGKPLRRWLLTGGGRTLFGFVFGALFVLLPVYYYNKGREAALREASRLVLPPADSGSAATSDSGEPLASRLTYGLSRTPEDLPGFAFPPTDRPVSERTRERARRAAAEEVASSRSSPARAIHSAPTPSRELSEGRVASSRGVSGARAKPVEPRYVEGRDLDPRELRPRYVEGRDLVLPSSPTATSSADVAAGVSSTLDDAAPASTKRNKPHSASRQPPVHVEVSARVTATQRWLESTPQSAHTIQLLTTSEARLERELAALARVLDPSKIYVFVTTLHGKPSTNVVYGAYADRSVATEALGKLPAPVAARRPFVRTLAGIRSDLAQHGSPDERSAPTKLKRASAVP